MRDEKVYLPVTIPREALFLDMNYLGFEHVKYQIEIAIFFIATGG
jgi:hypothetical protein